MAKIRVFIVENSILMQKIIGDIISCDHNLEVIGTAQTCKEALEKIPPLLPDVVTLDINLPDENGLTLLKQLMDRCPVRVVMVSAYTQKGAEMTLKALELGALDFIPKPSGEISLDLYNFKEEIISKIKLATTVDLEKVIRIARAMPPVKEIAHLNKIVVIGASTGGPKAIIDVMHQIPLNAEAAFLIVQHMPKGFTKTFAQRIFSSSNIKIKEAEDQDLILKGAGYVARSGFHMAIEKATEEKNRYCIKLSETPSVNYLKPAVDVTMKSVADVFDGKIIGVVLTGMGRDGLEGSRKIKAKGGKIIVQDESSCVVYGMPKGIIDEGLADDILPLGEIPRKIMEYLNK